MSKRTLSAILAMLMLASTATSCGSTNVQGGNDTTADNTPEVTTQSVESLVGFPKEDNGGTAIRLLVDSNKSYDFDAEEATGDVVSDAVYEKLITVSEYLGITFEPQFEMCGWNERNTFNSLIINDVTAGDSSYDMVLCPIVCTMPIAPEGYFLEGGNLTYCNFDNPWWMADMYDTISVAGSLYGFLGDISLSSYKDLAVVYFNKRIYDEYKVESPYALVRAGKWTLDKFIEYASSMGRDLNGDGNWTLEEDQISYLAEQVPNGTMQTSLQLKVVENKGGELEYVGLSEKYLTAYDKLGTMMNQAGMDSISTIDDLSFRSMKTFANGNVATMTNFLYATEHLRDMTDDYGIVPLPKYDANQSKHYAQMGTSTLMTFIPTTVKNPELVSKAMELCAYYTQTLVVPKYYEVALKDKYARDADIPEMLDIIREGATIDFLFVYGTSMSGTPNSHFRFLKNSPGEKSVKNDNLASSFASSETTFTTSLETMIEKYAALK